MTELERVIKALDQQERTGIPSQDIILGLVLMLAKAIQADREAERAAIQQAIAEKKKEVEIAKRNLAEYLENEGQK